MYNYIDMYIDHITTAIAIYHSDRGIIDNSAVKTIPPNAQATPPLNSANPFKTPPYLFSNFISAPFV